jgi:chaperonin cofactor prefoldin
LDVKIKVFEEKEKKFDNKIDMLKNKARELIAADKKKEAKKYV